MTKENFYQQIHDLSDKYENRDLEIYLLALYSLVEKFKEQNMTDTLFFELLSTAFIDEPAEFQQQWLSLDTPPHDNGLIRKFTNPEIKDSLDRTFYTNESGIDFTLEVLKFQISELHKMRGNQLDNEDRYFGIISETGNEWYNFDPHTILECGAACTLDNANEKTEEMEINWQTIGELLEDGRIYE